MRHSFSRPSGEIFACKRVICRWKQCHDSWLFMNYKTSTQIFLETPQVTENTGKPSTHTFPSIHYVRFNDVFVFSLYMTWLCKPWYLKGKGRALVTRNPCSQHAWWYHDDHRCNPGNHSLEGIGGAYDCCHLNCQLWEMSLKVSHKYDLHFQTVSVCYVG